MTTSKQARILSVSRAFGLMLITTALTGVGPCGDTQEGGKVDADGSGLVETLRSATLRTSFQGCEGTDLQGATLSFSAILPGQSEPKPYSFKFPDKGGEENFEIDFGPDGIPVTQNGFFTDPASAVPSVETPMLALRASECPSGYEFVGTGGLKDSAAEKDTAGNLIPQGMCARRELIFHPENVRPNQVPSATKFPDRFNGESGFNGSLASEPDGFNQSFGPAEDTGKPTLSMWHLATCSVKGEVPVFLEDAPKVKYGTKKAPRVVYIKGRKPFIGYGVHCPTAKAHRYSAAEFNACKEKLINRITRRFTCVDPNKFTWGSQEPLSPEGEVPQLCGISSDEGARTVQLDYVCGDAVCEIKKPIETVIKSMTIAAPQADRRAAGTRRTEKSGDAPAEQSSAKAGDPAAIRGE